jgi:hypothetical protein
MKRRSRKGRDCSSKGNEGKRYETEEQKREGTVQAKETKGSITARKSKEQARKTKKTGVICEGEDMGEQGSGQNEREERMGVEFGLGGLSEKESTR